MRWIIRMLPPSNPTGMRVKDTSPSSPRMRLLHLLQHAQTTQPNTPVLLEKLAQTVGISEARIRQLYKELAVDHQLPSLDTTSRRRAITPDPTRTRLLRLLQYAQATQPNTPVSLSKLAKVVGVTRERARVQYHKLAAEYQLPPVEKSGGWSEKRTLEHKSNEWVLVQKVKLLREQGLHATQIKRELGVSHERVERAITLLIRRGETSRKLANPQTLALEAEVRKYRAQGISAAEIAIKLGRPRQSVYSVLRRLDIPLSKRSGKLSAEQRLRQTGVSDANRGRNCAVKKILRKIA